MHTPSKRFRTAALAAVATLSGAALLIGGTATAGAQEVEDESPHISVVVTPAEVQGDCVPTGTGLSYVVFSDDSVFRLTVTAASPQCSPIDASAVIYGMPGNGEAWPQQLLEREPVVISAAGVYDITFTKECTPVQFDVVTGVTPQTITPGGEFHGPLLFPFDIETAEQYWGDAEDCPPPTTTTTAAPTTTVAPTTSSTPEVLPTSSVPSDVAGVTTVPVSPNNANNGTQVGGISQTRQPAALALTGTSAGLGAVGALLLVAGMVLLVAQRRRSA
jgi:hypothetical protein